MFRQALVRNVRLFSTSGVLRQKGPIEGAKDAVKTVDRTISDQLVKGIEKGGTFAINPFTLLPLTNPYRNRGGWPSGEGSCRRWQG